MTEWGASLVPGVLSSTNCVMTQVRFPPCMCLSDPLSCGGYMDAGCGQHEGPGGWRRKGFQGVRGLSHVFYGHFLLLAPVLLEWVRMIIGFQLAFRQLHTLPCSFSIRRSCGTPVVTHASHPLHMPTVHLQFAHRTYFVQLSSSPVVGKTPQLVPQVIQMHTKQPGSALGACLICRLYCAAMLQCLLACMSRTRRGVLQACTLQALSSP